MPGNKAIYDRAMDQSRQAARQKRWDDALKNALRAVQEFPGDNDARTEQAVALFNLQNYDQALQVLNGLRDEDPNNPFFLEYLALTYEGQHDTDAAIQTYRLLVQIHEQQRAIGRTIEVLRDILRLRPELDDERERLATLLRESGARNKAAVEYFNLARHYQERGMLDDSADRVEIALQLDPENREAKELLGALHEAMARAADTDAPAGGGGGGGGTATAAPTTSSELRPSAVSGRSGSLRSQQFVLEKRIAQAHEMQEAGDIDGAIQQYEEAINAGLQRADVFYSLGLLYQEREDHHEAVKMLEQAATDPEYALSAHFALGASYTELHQLPQAAQEYEQAIGLVDLQTVGRNESDDLVQMYEKVTDIYKQLGNEARAASLFSTLASFFQSRKWGKERAQEFSRRAKELQDLNMMKKLRSLGTGALVPDEPGASPDQTATLSPGEMLTEPEPETWGKIRPITHYLRAGADGMAGDFVIPAEVTVSTDPLELIESMHPPEPTEPVAPVTPLDTSGLNEQVARWIAASGKYIEQNLLDAAIDACYEVIRLEVDYLPIHLRIGEIYERQGFLNEALTKYQTLIDVFTVFGEQHRAIDVYFRFIELSERLGSQLPTISARARLAELLKQDGRVSEAAQQLAQVAAHYFRIGQNNRALEEYRRGIQWAPKDKEIHAQYGLTLFKLGRHEAALDEFRKAVESNTEDPVDIVRINMTLAVIATHPDAVWDSLATVLELIKNNPQASNRVQSEYRTALIEADEPVLHYILGIIQQYSNQHSSALLEFEQTQAMLESGDTTMLPLVLIHQAMADSYIALGQADEALAQLHQAHLVTGQARTEKRIKHPFARPLSQGELVKRMAEAHAASDDLEAAEQALREALRQFPYDRNIYTKLADVCFRQGKLKEALMSLEDLATYYENHQNLDHAIEILEDAHKLAPNNITIGNRLAHLYIRRGYPDKGVDSLVRVADLQRREGLIKDAVANLQQAAEIQNLLGRQQETLAIYDRIVSIAPDDVEARQWLSIMYTLASRTTEAINEKKQIARIYAQKRDFDNAIAELHQVIGLNQDDTEALYMLGDMLMRRGEYRQAVQLYKRMLRRDDIEMERVEALLAAANRMLEQQ